MLHEKGRPVASGTAKFGNGGGDQPSADYSTCLSAALSYAARGWHVFPLHSIAPNGHCTCWKRERCGRDSGKHPRTKNGFHDASTNAKIIRQWWDLWPDANVGIATGAVSNLVVLDVDPRNGGDASLAEHVATFGPLPETATVLTGGGGVHHYFTYPGYKVKSGPIGPGLDVKGDGGYVVAPPSNHRGTEAAS